MSENCKEIDEYQSYYLPGMRKFRTSNDILQKDISEYLGVTIAFISSVERGIARLSGEKLIMLLNNPFGWNTEYLLSAEPFKINNFQNRINGRHNIGGNENVYYTVNGVSEEEVKRRIAEATAIIRKDLEKAEMVNVQLKERIVYLENENQKLLDKILGKN